VLTPHTGLLGCPPHPQMFHCIADEAERQARQARSYAKLYEKRRSKDVSILEDIDAKYCTSEALTNRWFLPVKTTHLGRRSERNGKDRDRGLLKKNYIKRAKARRMTRQAHVAAEAALDTGANSDKAKKVSWHRSVKHSKVRRNARRGARDRKCYAADEPIEAQAIDIASKLFKRVKKPRPKEFHQQPAVISMLKQDSKGARLSDIFEGGIILSCAAAQDLQAMMADTRQATIDMLSPAQKPAISVKTLYYLEAHRKAAQRASGGRGAKAYMRQPSLVKAQGKRRS